MDAKVDTRQYVIFSKPRNFDTADISVFTASGQLTVQLKDRICNTYTTVCPPAREIIHELKARELPPVQADKPWYNYFIPPSSV